MTSPNRPASAVPMSSLRACYDSNTHGLGQIVYMTQPLQLRAPPSSVHAKVMRRRRSWFSFAIEAEDAMEQDTPAGYWVVRNLGRLRRKRDIACLGEMDTTSVFAFRDRNGEGPSEAKDEELVPVKYDEVLTLYTNFGLGGRFLSPVPGNIFKHPVVGWQSTTEEMQQASCFRDIGFSCQWIVRRGPSQRRSSVDRPGSPSRSSNRDADVVRCGDHIMLESVENPGHYAVVRRGIICIRQDTEGAELQLVAPSLRFAIQLRDKTPMYKKAASGFFDMEMNRTQENCGLSIRDILPKEILTYCFSFHQGCTPSYANAGKSAFQLQQAHDQRPLSQRRDGMSSLRSIRTVCREWRFLANHLVSSIRVGFMFELSARAHRNMLLKMVTECKNLTSLSLRNLDTLKDEDVIQLARNTNLRCLNLGGCYKVTDHATDVLAQLSLVHLNVAMTEITDYSLRMYAQSFRDLCTLNLYGVQHITEEGVRIILAHCKRLTSVNLRGTNLSHDATLRLRMGVNNGCDILTGAMLSTSVYGMPLQSQEGETNDTADGPSEQQDDTDEEDRDLSAIDVTDIAEAKSIAPFSSPSKYADDKAREQKSDDKRYVRIDSSYKYGDTRDTPTQADSKDDRSSFVHDSASDVREGLDEDEIFSDDEGHSMPTIQEGGMLTPRSGALDRRINVFEAYTTTTAHAEPSAIKHATSGQDYRRSRSAYCLSEEKQPLPPPSTPEGAEPGTRMGRRIARRRGSETGKTFFFRK